MKKLLLLLAFFGTVQSAKLPRQGIQGQVFWLSGNQMPEPGKNVSPQQGVLREVLIYGAATLRDVEQRDQFYQSVKTELVTTISTKSDGTFKVRLPEGQYSVFTKEANGLFANVVDKNGCVSCITVTPKHFSWISLTVDYEAVY